MKSAALVAAVSVLAAVTALTSSGAARADDVGSDMRDYYGGEKASAYLVGATGLAAAVGGGFLVTRDADLARGLGGAWLAMGSLETIGAVVYAVQVGAETSHYQGELARDPTGYRADEIDHLRGTSSRFVVYRAVELSLALAGAGAAAYGLASGKGGWQGAGIGVASLSLPFFVLDSINDARASHYLEEVRRFQPSVGMAPGNPRHGGFSLSLATRF
ncbi:MAG TPA: hypothetical protein VGG39_11345 [Polyangiaceae bacterium]